MKPSPVTVGAARWSAGHPWRAIALWVAFVAAAIALMSFVPTQRMTDADTRLGESGRAAQMIEDAGMAESPSESVVISSTNSGLDRAAASSAAADVRTHARDTEGVAGVGKPVWSPDGDALLVPIEMSGTPEDAADHVDSLLAATYSVQQDHPDLRVEQAGAASLDTGINDKVGEDLASGESLSLPITFAILLVAFGALIAAGIPVLLAFSSVIITLGLYAPLSYLVPDSGTVANVVLLIGMAVGVDYSLFYLKREREERRNGKGTVNAIEAAAATSGHAVVVSGLAVIVAMSGLFLTRDAVFMGLAVGSILVVAVSVLGSLTVLPALLAKLGRWVDRPHVPLLWRMNRRIGSGGISGRLIRPVISHPRVAAVLAGGLLVALAVPALGMKLHESTTDTLPEDIPAVQAYQRIQHSFPEQHPSIDVAVRTPAGSADDVRTALRTVQDRAQADGLVSAGGGQAVRTSDDGRTTLLRLTAAHVDGSKANEHAIEQMRDNIVPRAMDDVDGADWAVGGDIAHSVDSGDSQSSTLPWVIGFVLLLTLVMIGWTFRSVTIAGLTTVLNLLSIGAAFGVLSLVFQNSWADSLLGYESSGFVVDWIPLFCFVVLVGLSMDYHVFVLSRVREGLRTGVPHRAAVEFGVRETASVVTSAATVMISVFAVFATLSMLEMKQLGVGLSAAILIDATVVRLVLLPALLLMLERPLARLGRGGRRWDVEPVSGPREPQLV